jgi:hypothetical protein
MPRMNEVFLNEGTGEKLFTLETPGRTYVVLAPSRGQAIVVLSKFVGRDYIVQHRDQVQQHLSTVVVVDHSTDDVEELDPGDPVEEPAAGVA